MGAYLNEVPNSASHRPIANISLAGLAEEMILIGISAALGCRFRGPSMALACGQWVGASTGSKVT